MIKNKNQLATARGEKIFLEHSLSLPVNLIQFAKAHDINVIPKECASGVSGMLIRTNHDFTIAYSTHIDNAGFQRFSIAHELGHYFCPGHPEALFDDRNNTHYSNALTSHNQYEKEADAFAAGLLMPTKSCKLIMRKNDDGLKSITAISKACETSIIAAAIRYVNLSDIPCAIIVSINNTIDYCICNEELMKTEGYAHPQKKSILPVESLINLKRITNNLASKSEASSMNWFRTDTDIEMEEEIMNLSFQNNDGKWLTVLTISDCEE